MKRIVFGVLSLSLLLTVGACGGGANEPVIGMPNTNDGTGSYLPNKSTVKDYNQKQAQEKSNEAQRTLYMNESFQFALPLKPKLKEGHLEALYKIKPHVYWGESTRHNFMGVTSLKRTIKIHNKSVVEELIKNTAKNAKIVPAGVKATYKKIAGIEGLKLQYCPVAQFDEISYCANIYFIPKDGNTHLIYFAGLQEPSIDSLSTDIFNTWKWL